MAHPLRLLRASSCLLLAAAPACLYQSVEFRFGDRDGGDGGGTTGSFRVTVTVALPAGETVTLALNDGAPVTRESHGTYTFAQPVVAGTPYLVRVTSVSQGIGCGVVRGRGVMPAADVDDVLVTCAAIVAAPVYPNAGAGAQWLEFVANDGPDPFSGSGALCDVDVDGPRGYLECLHAGELRQVALPMIADCGGLVAHDSSLALAWHCYASDSGIVFRSLRTYEGRGLADLLIPDGSGFAPLRVEVTDDRDLVALTDPDTWWSNPIQEVTETTPGLDAAPGTIFVVPGDVVRSAPLRFLGSRLALVTLGPATLSGTEVTGSAGDDENLVAANDLAFLWLEGRYDVSYPGGFSRLFFRDVRYMTARNVTLRGEGSEPTLARGFDLCGSTAGLFEDLRSVGNAEYGVTFNGGERNILRRVRIADSTDPTGAGLFIGDYCGRSYDNTFADLVISNSSGHAILNRNGVTWDNANNRFVGVTVLGAGDAGIELGDHDLLVNATVLNADGSGFYLAGRDGVSVMNLVSGGNGVGGGGGGGGGVTLSAATNVTFHNLAVPQNGVGIELVDSAYGFFSGSLLVDELANVPCHVSETGGYPGLVDSSCANNGSSTAVLAEGIELNDALVLMPSGDSGAALLDGVIDHAAIDNWTDFDTPQRGFGAAGSSFPHPTALGACGAAESCRLWDASCRAQPTPVCDGLALPGGDDVLVHLWTVAEAGDCATIAGATWSPGVCEHPGYTSEAICTNPNGANGDWTSAKCVSTYLQNAVELSGDFIGNDNGLCETDEHCLVTPNLGADQGHGALEYLGSLAPGKLTGVELFRYRLNGY